MRQTMRVQIRMGDRGPEEIVLTPAIARLNPPSSPSQSLQARLDAIFAQYVGRACLLTHNDPQHRRGQCVACELEIMLADEIEKMVREGLVMLEQADG